MKVLIFSVAYQPFIGGAEIAVKEITDRILPSEIEFHMVTVNLDGKQKKEEKIGNVHVYRIGSAFFHGFVAKLFFPFLGAWKGLRLHNGSGGKNGQMGLKFDHIWAIMAGYGGFAALFFKYFQPKVRFMLTLQEGDPISYIRRQVWFVYPLFLQIFRKADRIQTISHYLVNFARSQGARSPISVIPNGVDVSIFSREHSPIELEDLKNKMGKRTDVENRPGDIFLVTASRLVAKNGIADVIRSLSFLPTNVKFVVVGTGPLEQALKRLAQKIGVSDRVIFTGFVQHADLPKYLQISDIFIRPSLSEGMGNSFIEAMAAGLPVIATPVGGIPDFLKHGETGVFCAVKDPKSIADAVRTLLANSDLKRKIIVGARKMVIEKYDWKLLVERIRSEFFSSSHV
jgi:glycosyltransferase involved in cell wall biosynthesis